MKLYTITPGEAYKAKAYLGKGKTEKQAFKELTDMVKRERPDLVYTRMRLRTNESKKTILTLYFKKGD